MTSVVGWRRLVRHVINELTQGRNHVVNVGVQFLALGYCTEQNTDGIPSFVHCSLLPNGNHILIQKSWGGPSKFWGSRPPSPPSGCALELTANVPFCGAGRVRSRCGRRTVEHVDVWWWYSWLGSHASRQVWPTWQVRSRPRHDQLLRLRQNWRIGIMASFSLLLLLLEI